MSDDKDCALVVSTADRLLFRWFAQASGFAALLQDAGRKDDDVVIFEDGGIRIEVSLHTDAADCRRVRDDVLRRANELGGQIALAMAPTRGAA